MWKRRTLIYLLLVTFTDSKETAIESISWRLDRTYDYILKNYDLVNVDCVFGVVLSQGEFLDGLRVCTRLIFSVSKRN